MRQYRIINDNLQVSGRELLRCNILYPDYQLITPPPPFAFLTSFVVEGINDDVGIAERSVMPI